MAITQSQVPEDLRHAWQRGEYAAAIAGLEPIAEAGDPEAQYLLANSLEVGQNSLHCVEWYRRSAAQGNARAQDALGWLHIHGKYVPRDAKTGVPLLESALANGYQPAHTLADQLAAFYRDGIGVAQDWNRAFQLFQEAIREGVWGFAYSHLDVAWSQYWGLGTQRDERQAVATYSEFLKKLSPDNAEANLALAVFHVLGVGMDRDPSQAVVHLQSAARSRARAAFLLGHCHLTGYGVPMDQERGNEILASANARLNVPIDPLDSDISMVAARMWSSMQDAWLGKASAQFAMGNFSLNQEKGSGYVEAREINRWLRIAASNGDPRAQLRFAERFLYHKGSFVPGDRHTGLAWARRAAEQGLDEAMMLLASRLEDDDLDEALHWFRAAAKRGMADAAEPVLRIEAKLAFQSEDYERAAQMFSKLDHPGKALQWLRSKASLSLQACLGVARAFETGRLFDGKTFLDVDLNQAFDYYRRAKYWNDKTAHEKAHGLRPRATRALVKDFTGNIEPSRRVECDRAYKKEEWEDIQRGLAAYSMDDKWILFVEGERLFILRSWTGFLWAVAHFEVGESGAHLTHLVVTPEVTAPDEDLRKLVYWLIDYFLLGNMEAECP